MRRAVPSIVLALILGAIVHAGGRDESQRAQMLGTLTYTPLSVRFEEVPAREALKVLSRAIAIPIVGRFIDDGRPGGIDPDLPISLFFDRTEALHVLEAVLEQCEEFEPCTWQLRNGFIEVGTKERLSAPSASETRLYPIRDLLIEPPYFKGPSLASIGGGSGLGSMASVLSTTQPAAADFDSLPYATAVLSKPAALVPDGVGNAMVARKRPEELAEEIVQGIVELVEPGNWDYGQFEEAGSPSVPAGGAPGARSRQARPGGDKIARLRRLRDTIIVHAPDYIHRQIATGAAVPPRPLTAEERADRSALASSEGATIVVLPAAPRARPGAGR